MQILSNPLTNVHLYILSTAGIYAACNKYIYHIMSVVRFPIAMACCVIQDPGWEAEVP